MERGSVITDGLDYEKVLFFLFKDKRKSEGEKGRKGEREKRRKGEWGVEMLRAQGSGHIAQSAGQRAPVFGTIFATDSAKWSSVQESNGGQ